MARKQSKILGKREANREAKIKELEKDIASAKRELAKMEKALAALVAKRKSDVPAEPEPSAADASPAIEVPSAEEPVQVSSDHPGAVGHDD